MCALLSEGFIFIRPFTCNTSHKSDLKLQEFHRLLDFRKLIGVRIKGRWGNVTVGILAVVIALVAFVLLPEIRNKIISLLRDAVVVFQCSTALAFYPTHLNLNPKK